MKYRICPTCGARLDVTEDCMCDAIDFEIVIPDIGEKKPTQYELYLRDRKRRELGINEPICG